jgi:hypothetical protein
MVDNLQNLRGGPTGRLKIEIGKFSAERDKSTTYISERIAFSILSNTPHLTLPILDNMLW